MNPRKAVAVTQTFKVVNEDEERRKNIYTIMDLVINGQEKGFLDEKDVITLKYKMLNLVAGM